jgi:hypothetical protein
LKSQAQEVNIVSAGVQEHIPAMRQVNSKLMLAVWILLASPRCIRIGHASLAKLAFLMESVGITCTLVTKSLYLKHAPHPLSCSALPM